MLVMNGLTCVLFSLGMSSFLTQIFFCVGFRHVRKIASVCLSACMEKFTPTGQIFMKLIYEYFAKICQDKAGFIKIRQE